MTVVGSCVYRNLVTFVDGDRALRVFANLYALASPMQCVPFDTQEVVGKHMNITKS